MAGLDAKGPKFPQHNNITNRSKIVGKRLNKSFFVIIFNDFINNILSQVHIMSILCRN